MIGVVDAEHGNCITLPPNFCGPKADIRTVEVEVRKFLVKPQTGGLPQNQDDFIQGLYGRGSLKRPSDHSGVRCIYPSMSDPIPRLPVAP